MRLLRGSFELGALPPNPRDLPLFSARMDNLLFSSRGQAQPVPAFPAPEPVARVASQHCPIPSDSGKLSINQAVRRLNEKAANGDYPLTFVSHVGGSLQAQAPTAIMAAEGSPVW